ncbi:GHMP kinase [Vibrio sp. La 4.2.2]|uniref:GHMP family kinase ATP-binding protein n=1 Tax=Vibrio sp. La 4.2.2 TaxID=2998830 RepID=UPI0022CE191E|nr:GHMP kinase [Vibrio sp. La 4.2.2]MDA0110535.1 GHMP kinase [Vibrio sp. La 4.2.2]
MKVRSRAPLRLGLAGGGTDVSPYCDQFGGYVLNTTISLYAHCTIETVEEGELYFHAKDIEETWNGSAVSVLECTNDNLQLIKAIYNRIVKDYNDGQPLSVGITTYADSPLGSGLGTSSAITVAVIKAFQELLNIPIDEYGIAELAYDIERKDCGLAGGKQDQYAAAFGGFNFIEFKEDDVIVHPLNIKQEFKNELETCLLTYFTGSSRASAKIIEEQKKSVHSKDSSDALNAMHAIKQSAVDMKEALLKSSVSSMADILKRSWEAKKQTSKSISNPLIEEIYDVAVENGAISAKVSGAGGGGFVMMFVKPTYIIDVITNLSELPGSAYPVKFESEGATSWKVIS